MIYELTGGKMSSSDKELATVIIFSDVSGCFLCLIGFKQYRILSLIFLNWLLLNFYRKLPKQNARIAELERQRDDAE